MGYVVEVIAELVAELVTEVACFGFEGSSPQTCDLPKEKKIVAEWNIRYSNYISKLRGHKSMSAALIQLLQN